MRNLDLRTWSTPADLARGSHQGTTVRDDGLVLDRPAGLRVYTDPHGDGSPRRYECAAWVSPEVRTDSRVTSLVPSWNARTPDGCWVEVEMRVVTQQSGGAASRSRWYVLGRWAEGDAEIHPTSVPGQEDDVAAISTDVLQARPGRSVTAYQLRVSLLRREGTAGTPRLTLAAVVASGPAPRGSIPSGTRPSGGPAWGTVLDVPAYSQQIHRGEYPQWADGGEAWCSPTCTSMLLAYWGTGPTPDEYAWVDPAYQDRWVDYAARHTFDHAYEGAGNWAFNTAYAARFGMVAYVTRLRSLADAERCVAAGIPLVVTVSFTRDELTGAGYDTEGHLLTIIGFDEAGDVVSNDPASHLEPSNDKVRTTYDRAEFERVWQDAAGGVAYVIHPPGHPVPDLPGLVRPRG